jgi:hypothetical protein
MGRLQLVRFWLRSGESGHCSPSGRRWQQTTHCGHLCQRYRRFRINCDASSSSPHFSLTPATAADERRSDVPGYFIENEKVLVDVRGLEPLTPCLQSRPGKILTALSGVAYTETDRIFALSIVPKLRSCTELLRRVLSRLMETPEQPLSYRIVAKLRRAVVISFGSGPFSGETRRAAPYICIWCETVSRSAVVQLIRFSL